MSESFSARLRVLKDLDQGGVTDALFTARVLDGGFSELRTARWATSERSLDRLGPAVLRHAGEHHQSGVYERDGALVSVDVHSGFVSASAAASDEEAALAALADLREQLPPPEPLAKHEVPVMFWTYTPHGPMPSMRVISVPEWDEISDNYSHRTREQLAAIMRGFRPAHGGQLILWHGDVGTGKTFALRALAWEWREWCQLHYIVDPDTFFGERSDYLMGVLTQPEDGPGFFPYPIVTTRAGISRAVIGFDDEDLDEDGEGDSDSHRHWRLLVLEDTGELLRPDAKSIIGQGLSRFLNVVDGLIGQGLRVLVLVTTNEEIRTLHPAVARPGRCAANIEFRPLTEDEAAHWLEQRGGDGVVEAPRILASLYAQLEGRDPAEPVQTTGFGE